MNLFGCVLYWCRSGEIELIGRWSLPRRKDGEGESGIVQYCLESEYK